jgi:hypothetical protein
LVFSWVAGDHCSDSRVLLWEPWTLNVSLLLRIILLAVDLSNQVWDDLGSLLFEGSHVCSCHSHLCGTKFLTWCVWMTIKCSVFSWKVTSVVLGNVLG